MEAELTYLFFFVVLMALVLCHAARNDKPPHPSRPAEAR